jgi:hypothetical protein
VSRLADAAQRGSFGPRGRVVVESVVDDALNRRQTMLPQPNSWDATAGGHSRKSERRRQLHGETSGRPCKEHGPGTGSHVATVREILGHEAKGEPLATDRVRR